MQCRALFRLLFSVGLMVILPSGSGRSLADGDAPTAAADHWAFQPIQSPEPPHVEHSAWVRNGIDAFILKRLEREGIGPSPEADRETLFRRLYLDLIGLPPSPEDWSTWMTDPGEDWYESLVDHLLASPHYGERWGRHWLDLARYADSDGYEKDLARPHAWRWRTWVINALNRDMPFDQFTTVQLAGDLLPDATLECKVATGFHRNTLINREGGTDPEEDRVKRTVDRTNTLGKVWLGMTVECAQCHTHKYDPLSQREYYQLYAFFNSLTELEIGAPLHDELAAYQEAKAKYDDEHEPLLTAIRHYEENALGEALQKWESKKSDREPVWFILRPESLTAEQGTTLELLPDGSVLASGNNPGREEIYTLVGKTDRQGITGIRIEALADERLPGGGPGRGIDADFQLTSLRVEASQADQSDSPVHVPLENAQADFEKDGGKVENALGDNFGRGWSVAPHTGQSHVATFETKEPVGHGGGTILTITMRQASTVLLYRNLGRFRISVTSVADKPLPLYGLTDAMAQTLALPEDQRSEIQRGDLRTYYRMIDPELAKLRSRAEEHQKIAPTDPSLRTKAQVVTEMERPRSTHLLIRGDFLQLGEELAPDTPAVLPPLIHRSDRPDRLDLATWLFDPAHPLTSRVTVNRFWQRYFGRGLVATVDDFGTQGAMPSHAELLEWLASEFRDHDWRLKSLHRLIVTSSTYRQSAAARPDLAERDPYNAWLSHQNRLRVEAEVVRDLALAASGLIKHRIGGPSVRPPQPDGVAMLGYANSVKWSLSEADDRYRRGLYTFFQRTVPYPMLVTFDAPDSNLSCTQRERSNTPLQSLTIWNDPVFFECAQALGRRIVHEVPASEDSRATIDRRIRHAFKLCLAREPTQRDLEVARKLYEKERDLAAADPVATSKIVGDDSMPPEQAADQAAWILVGRTLMNLDEFVTRS